VRSDRTPTLRAVACVGALGLCVRVSGCDLCAIYNASDSKGQFGSGFLLAVSEQYIPYNNQQWDGEPVKPANREYLNSSITHLVPTYNFSPRLGISLNLPVVDYSFQRSDLRYSLTSLPVRFTEKGTETGLGDMALVGRWTVFQTKTMDYGVALNLLGGLQMPTGDPSRLRDEAEQDRVFVSIFQLTAHDPLGHSTSYLHQHDLALGSGSWDGIMGATLNARWRRWFVNTQIQYYLRTEGEATFQYGNELLVSTGPGYYLLSGHRSTLSLRANASYESMAKDTLFGIKSDLTGEMAWYLGPQFVFTWHDHFVANAQVDVPMRIANHGLQTVPEYRIVGGVSWRF